MYKFEKTSKNQNKILNPSFSSTLLDQIYRSIDESETNLNNETTKFYREQKPTVTKIQTDTKNNKPKIQKVFVAKETNSRKSHQLDLDHDHDVLFFSSTSISSDSSSGGFSSSDTDSLYGTKSRASARDFAATRVPKQVRTTSASFRFENEKQGNRVFNGFCRSSETKQGTENHGEEAVLIRSKSRALKIYNNLKKVKQPISPGGRLTSFLNSLFEKKSSKSGYCENERKVASTCSSASSFSRLSKTTSFWNRGDSIYKKQLSNCGVNKTVRFCGAEENKVVEEATRNYFNEYRYKHNKKNDLVLLKDLGINENDYDDDVASCASSDLFELDHLDVLGDGRYCEELPVFGTTRVN
ncbi:protein BIG GRAIN 1-like A [Cicer arietinum]|uniref:Protein BIG GRAIN 1-like B n=1 Tax=Cicer arietinum TaxID=3827 RepID=A0A1S2Y3S4_CICAR|nr:protein BIG GRAIN 1-like B [Cicer arietinum]